MAKGVIKLRMLRWGDDPGLSRWALNIIICVPIKLGPGRFHTAEEKAGIVTTQPQVRKCQPPPEGGRGKE